MTDNLTVDGATLANVSTSLSAQSTAIPLQSTIVVNNCGSAVVRSAANGFSMWASVTELVSNHALSDVARTLRTVAVTFGDWDDRAAQRTNRGML